MRDCQLLPRACIALDLERADMQLIKPGDRITIDMTYYRKWWQIWKPRTWTEIKTYECTGEMSTTLDPNGVLYVSGGGSEQIREI